jgi:hypothetical protein
VVLAELCGLEHAAPEVEEGDSVEDDGSEFRDEDPEVVAVKTFVFVFGA